MTPVEEIAADCRGLEEDLAERIQRALFKRYRAAVRDAIQAVKALPPTATDDEIVNAGKVAVPRPEGL